MTQITPDRLRKSTSAEKQAAYEQQRAEWRDANGLRVGKIKGDTWKARALTIAQDSTSSQGALPSSLRSDPRDRSSDGKGGT